MRFFRVLASSVLPLLVTSAGVSINNLCQRPIFVLSVKAGGAATGSTAILAGATYHEAYRELGRAIKFYNSPTFQDPHLILGYSFSDQLWTSLATVPGNASPFQGSKLTLRGIGVNSPVDCRDITWPDGLAPAQAQVNYCRWDAGVILTLCAP